VRTSVPRIKKKRYNKIFSSRTATEKKKGEKKKKGHPHFCRGHKKGGRGGRKKKKGEQRESPLLLPLMREKKTKKTGTGSNACD